jgi:glycosyltransferase involved in cell wall biosynthesis
MGVKVFHIATVDLSLRFLLLNQMTYLRDLGYDVAGVSTPGPDVETLEAAGIRHIGINISRKEFSPLSDLASLWRLYRLFRREKPAIVHTHTPKPGLLGRLAARLARVPIIVNTIHGYHFHSGMSPRKVRLYVLVERFAARGTHMSLSQSKEDVDTAIAEKISPPERIQHLGNGIDLGRFNPGAASERSETRARLGIPEGYSVIGFVGRLKKGKGLLDLFAAAELVSKHNPNIRFLVIGGTDEGKSDAITPEDAKRYQVGDTIDFLGPREDLPDLLAAMDVFVLPSYIEGFPRSAMEACAMGLPAVLTDIRGCREVVTDGDNGRLVPPGDPEALAQAIVELIEDPAMARRMGRRGLEIAHERFDERIVFRQVASTYEELLKGKGMEVPLVKAREETHDVG